MCVYPFRYICEKQSPSLFVESQVIKQFTEELDEANVLVNFHGEVHENRISEILGDVESKLESTEEDFKKQRKVYNILVETLQNLYHHTDTLANADGKKVVTLILGKQEDEYAILAANYIDLDNIPPLKAKLDKINSLDKDGLRAYYKEVLDNGQYSVHGGGGLGMIDIARKSGNKLDYHFSEVSDTFGLYVLKLKV
jgi:hypothetical protein